MIDYSSGYTSSFYATFVDPNTWTDYGRLEIISGNINRTDSDLRQSANLTLREYDYEGDMWIRIYMEAEQNGTQERIPIFTGIATSPNKSYANGVPSASVQCYSVLKPAEDILLECGWYANKNANCIDLLEDLLRPTKVKIDFRFGGEEPRLNDYIIAEENENNLSMIEYILLAMESVMWIDGDGTVVLSPDPTYNREIDSVMLMASYANDIIESNFTINHDWFNCPNCLRVIYNELSAVAKDEDDDSPLSIQNRGREVWAGESNPDLLEDETLAEYAANRLKELQEMSETVSYNRRFFPGVNVGQKVSIAYPELTGVYIVTSQNITLGHAAVTSEEVKRSV